MPTFRIPSATGAGSLEFLERTPTDPRRPIERFKVRLVDQDLSALGRVYVGRGETHPVGFFSQMAANWNGWQGAFAWESPTGELSLRAEQDRRGHVSLRVVLRSGSSEGDWEARATIQAEAGQLEELARQAAEFFGEEG